MTGCVFVAEMACLIFGAVVCVAEMVCLAFGAVVCVTEKVCLTFESKVLLAEKVFKNEIKWHFYRLSIRAR